MSKEIERKFIVKDPAFLLRNGYGYVKVIQGYLAADENKSIRIRIIGDKAWLTIKTGGNKHIRDEFEYKIPVEEADNLLDVCIGKTILKNRYSIPIGKYVWEVDVFIQPKQYIIAEIELDNKDEEIELPSWIGEEVTNNPNYYNVIIADI